MCSISNAGRFQIFSVGLILAVLGTALPAGAAELSRRTSLASGLRHLVLHADSPEMSTRLASWIQRPDQTATDRDGNGRWMAADAEVLVVDGDLIRHELGVVPRLKLIGTHEWVALGPDRALVNGVIRDDPDVVAGLAAYFPGFQPSDDTPLTPVLNQGESETLAPPEPASTEFESSVGDATNNPLATGFDEIFDRRSVIRDTQPPIAERVEIILRPDEPARRRIVQPGPDVFVGQETVGLQIRMSERMAVAPRVRVVQPNAPEFVAGLVDDSQNPLFIYRFFPLGGPSNNGPVTLEILGQAAGTGIGPAFGVDEAGNPVDPNDDGSTLESAFRVDTVPPDLKRVDVRQPGQFRSIPGENDVLPAAGFPREILVLVLDYNQPDDGSFAGPNVETDQASGVDFDAAARTDGGLAVRLRGPQGREIPGTLVSSPPQALKLLLPDVYDPATGVFPDTDGDGRADPIEGAYTVEVDLIDRAGNRTLQTLTLANDTTPIRGSALNVAIEPVFSDPFTNPTNPIPERGAAVKQLREVRITSSEPDFDFSRSRARILSRLTGDGTVPREVRTTLQREDARLILTIVLDQDGDGNPDFENPAPGPFLPPGMTDPRIGMNDGPYIVEVTAIDEAGNETVITRDLVLDTTAPDIGTTFPGEGVAFGPPLRIVDAILMDPQATSNNPGSGIRLDVSDIRLRFLGNSQSPSRLIDGVAFVHEPNSTDPTRPGFDPNDKFPKVLFQFTDDSGQSTPLPDDGTLDGVYQIEVDVTDRAGNPATGITTFSYDSSSPPTTDVVNITSFRSP